MNKFFIAALIAAPVFLTACNNSRPQPAFDTAADTISYELGMANSAPIEQLKSYLADARTGSDSVYVEEFLKGLREGLLASGNKEKAAYVAGLQLGSQMGTGLSQTALQLFEDSTKTLNNKNFLAGFIDAMYGEKSALKIDGKVIDAQAARVDVQERMSRLREEAMARKYEANKKAAEAFIAQKAKEQGIVKLSGGTLCKVITKGEGATAKEGDRVNVVYEGRLTNGTVFDSSAAHPGSDGKSTPMTIGYLVPGFNEVLKAFPAGTELEVYLPYDQAYGAQGSGDVPPFSALIFKMTILGTEEAPAAPAAPKTIK